MKKLFYIYIAYDPRPSKNLEPIYVGKGCDRRKNHIHNEQHYNPFLRRVVTKIREADLKPIVEIVQYFEIEADAFQLETELIARYGRRDLNKGSLCNLTDGGEGQSGSLAMRRRLDAEPELAKYYVEQGSQKMLKLHADPDFAKANAKRASNILRELHANPKFAEDHIKRNSERIRKLNADPVFAKDHSERMSKRNADPEYQARIKAGQDTYWAKPETKQTQSEQWRKRKADPEFEARRKAGVDAYWAKKRAEKNQ